MGIMSQAIKQSSSHIGFVMVHRELEFFSV
jgi:hypothetical protein